MPWLGSEYRPRTGAEWLTWIKGRYATFTASLGLPAPRWELLGVVNLFATVQSYIAGDLDEALATIPDARSVRNATGQALRDIADLVGVAISAGSASTATVSVTAWSTGPVVISPSDVFRGGGTDGLAEWSPIETVTVSAGSSADVAIQCRQVGAITAEPDTITTKVRCPAGVTAVTNAAAATPGSDADTEDDIRAAILAGSSVSGSRSPEALRAAIEAIPGVSYARVYANPDITAATVSGVTVPACGYAVWVYPKVLTDDVKLQVCQMIRVRKDGAKAIAVPASTGATGVKMTYTAADGRPRSVGFWYAREYATQVKVTVTRFESGYSTVAQVQDGIRAAITKFYADIQTGDVFAQQDLTTYVIGVAGVGRATVEYKLQANPGTDPAGDTWGGWISTDTVPDVGDTFVLYGTPAVST